MPVYNGERHLRSAVDSILSQTYRDFEFLIIDDGSTDRSVEIVSTYVDPRIRLVLGGKNGLSATLNRGLQLANGRLIARQDADDLSESDRLERQYAVMTARPDLALLGCQATTISEDGKPTGIVRRCTTADAIRWYSAFANPFLHTSVMFRADVARELGGFNGAYDPFAQDYDLWCRLLESHRALNLPGRLVRYRVSDTSLIGSLDGAHA